MRSPHRFGQSVGGRDILVDRTVRLSPTLGVSQQKICWDGDANMRVLNVVGPSARAEEASLNAHDFAAMRRIIDRAED